MVLRKILLAGAGAASLAFFLTPVFGQQQYDPGGKARVSTYCQTTKAGDTPCGVSSGTGGGGSSSANVATSLPTIGAATSLPYQSKGGGTYVQPVFGSATGGGTQVDNGHGLPIAIATSLPAGSNILGKESQVDSGGTDATDTVNHAVKVDVVAGATGNAAASATGSAVPASADYNGGNVAGTLRGITATNYTGSSYALDVNVATSPLATNPIPAQTVHGQNIGGVEGLAAALSAAAGDPVQQGCVVHTAAPTAGTDGQMQPNLCGERGQQVIQPHSIKELMVRGATSVSNTATTVLIPAQGAGLKIYVTSMQCFRTDLATTMDYWTLTDTASTPLGIPGTGAFVTTFPVPLVATAANVPFSGKPAIGAATEYCNAQGYSGP